MRILLIILCFGVTGCAILNDPFGVQARKQYDSDARERSNKAEAERKAKEAAAQAAFHAGCPIGDFKAAVGEPLRTEFRSGQLTLVYTELGSELHVVFNDGKLIEWFHPEQRPAQAPAPVVVQQSSSGAANAGAFMQGLGALNQSVQQPRSSPQPVGSNNRINMPNR